MYFLKMNVNTVSKKFCSPRGGGLSRPRWSARIKKLNQTMGDEGGAVPLQTKAGLSLKRRHRLRGMSGNVRWKFETAGENKKSGLGYGPD
jgi:hypothetical protein